MKTPWNQRTIEHGMYEAREKFAQEMALHPPTIGLIGVSGTGKSSTINRMFKTRLAVSHTVACTKEFSTHEVNVSVAKREFSGVPMRLHVVDAPGLGEDLAFDPEYIAMYQEYLGACDVILWVLQARNRALALDQMYLQRLSTFSERMVFGINQVDLVHPMNWDYLINLPSTEMESNIVEIVNDRTQKLSSVLQHPIKVIPYSAERGYRLEELFAALIEACPPIRRWIFALLKNFKLEDFYPI